MLKKLFRKKKDNNEGDPSISAPLEVVHAVHIDKEMNWTFDKSVDPKTIFTKLKVIGKGGFGTVSQIIHRPSMKILAGKLINQSLVQDDNSKEEIQHEIDLMREVDSPYTVRYYGCVNFEGSLMILMEYIDRGSLRDILDYREQVLSEDQISCVMSDLLNGLKKIHNDFHILHRDIKAANLLLNSEGRMKLADFGVSRQFENGGSSSTMTIVGTPYWMAPEVISGIAYSYPADVWSVGITAVELAEGAPPYVEYSPTKAMVEIATKGFPGYRFPQMHSPEFTDFVSHCVVFNQKDRWTVERLLQHPFIKRSNGYNREVVMSDLIKEGAANLGISSSSQLNSSVSLSKQNTSPETFGSSSSPLIKSDSPLEAESFETFNDCANAVISQNMQNNQMGTFVGPQGDAGSSILFTPTPETADSTFNASGFNSFVDTGNQNGMSSFVYNPNAATSSGFNSFVSTGNGEGMSSFVYNPNAASPSGFDSFVSVGNGEGMSSFVYNPNAASSSGFDSFVSTGNQEGMSSFVYNPNAAASNVGTFVGPSSNQEGMSSFVCNPNAAASNIGTFVGPNSNQEGMSSFVYNPNAAASNVGTFVGPNSNQEGMSSFVYNPNAAASNIGTFVGPSSNQEGMSSFVYTPNAETNNSTFKAAPNTGTFVGPSSNQEGMSSFVYNPNAAASNIGTFVGPSSNQEGMSSFVYTPNAAAPNLASTSDFGTFVASHQTLQNQDHTIIEEGKDAKGNNLDRVVTFDATSPSNGQSLIFEQKDDDTYVITRNDLQSKKKKKPRKKNEDGLENLETKTENDQNSPDDAIYLSQLDNKAFMQVSRAMSRQIPFSPLLIATNQDAPIETLYMPVDSTMMRKKILPPLFDEDGVINMTAAIRHEKATLICAAALVIGAFLLFGSNGFFFLLGVSFLTHMSVVFMSTRKERHEILVKKAKEAREERNKRKVEIAQQNKKLKKNA